MRRRTERDSCSWWTAPDSARLEAFARVFDLFDGNDEARGRRQRARRWSAAKAAGHTLSYWQQGPKGWAKQA